RAGYDRRATMRSRIKSATRPTMTAVRRIERHRHRTESRSRRNVSGAKIRNPMPASLRRTHEAQLCRVERPGAGPGLEGDGRAFGEIVEPAVAHGIAPKGVRLAV